MRFGTAQILVPLRAAAGLLQARALELALSVPLEGVATAARCLPVCAGLPFEGAAALELDMSMAHSSVGVAA